MLEGEEAHAFNDVHAMGKGNAPSNQLVLTVQRKNWLPLVLAPALAMDRMPTAQLARIHSRVCSASRCTSLVS